MKTKRRALSLLVSLSLVMGNVGVHAEEFYNYEKVITKENSERVFSYEDKDVSVEAKVDANSSLPEDVQFVVSKVPEGSTEYLKSVSTVRESLNLGHSEELDFTPYDIHFTDGENSIEPDDSVQITITQKDGVEDEKWTEDEDYFVAHIKEDGNVERLENVSKEEGKVEFTTSSFSIMGPAKIVTTTESGNNLDNESPIEPIIIDEFKVNFSRGADVVDDKLVWTPTSSSKGHSFIYRVDYSMSGIFSTDIGAFRIELPLHILKDRDGNWADKFDCPYFEESSVPEDIETPDFVYSIDEENNKVVIYNYKPYPTGDAGYIEFSYSTTEATTSYVDMGFSDKVSATVYATNAASTVTATAEADPVGINTYAKLSFTQKRTPDFYSKWDDSWGEKPNDSDDYLYLVWVVRSNISKCTSAYDFYLEDEFSDYEGEVVGYKFSGQETFSEANHIDNVTTYGDRYDYVLTRYRKDAVADLLLANKKYEVNNSVTARVSPVDHIDEDTSASSSKNWWYEQRLFSTGKEGSFYAEKYGVYGKYSTVYSSENVSDYSLGDFQEGEINSIDGLRYYVNFNGYPYPWTLPDGVKGTYEDAVNGMFGQKKVNYELVDETFYLEDSQTPLNAEDYDITSIEWSPSIRTAIFNEDTATFKETAVANYTDEDAITISVKIDGVWIPVATYDMVTKEYNYLDNTYVESTSEKTIYLKKGVKGYKFNCSNAYYHTKFVIYPEVSLNRTESVLALIGSDTGKMKVSLTNKAEYKVTQEEAEIYSRVISAKDYIQKVEQESEIKKDVVQTKNLKKESQYVVSWKVSVQEKYTDKTGVHSILQQSGIFYDLLPAGSILDISSINILASGNPLVPGGYTLETINNFRNSGRTLVVINIPEPTTDRYVLSYDTRCSYDSIKDFGKDLLNSVAYETGNDKIAEGYHDDGGTITDKDILFDLDKSTDDRKFLYSEARYSLAVVVASNTGLTKQIRNSRDVQYSYETTVYKGEDYSYLIRLANDTTTKSKDIVFFDSLENFFQDGDIDTPTKASDWKGTLAGIDLSNLTYKGVRPVVYLSKIENLNIQNHHNLSEKVGTEYVWERYDTFVEKYGLEEAKAIAVDASKSTNGSDFVLDYKESMSFTIYMKAPSSDTTGVQSPTAYNNIYMERTAVKESDTGEEVEISQFYHQDFTKASYRIVNSINLTKVDATDMETPIKGAVFKLQGVSDYGTSYNEERVSDKDGYFSFENIEKGNYTLIETSCSDDWQLNTEVYNVKVDSDGLVSISGLSTNEGRWIVKNEPRVHADLDFCKLDSISKLPIKGTKFRLSGTSFYGNDVLQYVFSDDNGIVSFTNIELGTYELVESETIDGYIKPVNSWKVQIVEPGIAFLYDSNGSELSKESDKYCIYNEPYHSIRFLKSSTYGNNIYLEGAEFSLTGVSDYGTDVSKVAVSGSSDDGGLVVFDGLEPGSYLLRETKAPEEHDVNETIYSVKVYPDGSFNIDGLGLTEFGNAEVYDFKDPKTSGTVCVTKEWMGTKEGETERPVPDISISTRKPSLNPLGYTIRFEANGGTFGDGTVSRNIVYNSSNNIVSGSFLLPSNGEKVLSGWGTEPSGGTIYEVSNDGIPAVKIESDMTLYAQWKTVVLKEGTEFKKLVPSSATSAEFVYEKAPEGATLINVDEDGDGGVVGWVDEGVFKISTQLEGVKSIANTNCFKMFNDRTLTSIKFDALDTSRVTNMQEMFSGCKNLLYLDISSFDTHNVTNMKYMFHYLTSIKNLDVSMLDTSSATDMFAMFGNCVMLKSLDVSNFDTSKVIDMQEMFRCCSSLTDLDLSGFDTSNVKIMYKMFYDCNSLVNLNVSGFNVEKVGNMSNMFYNCKNLTSLDVSSFKTNSATNMSSMFYNCSNVSELDVSGFNTTNVTDMSNMFYNCGKVSSLDTTNFKTSNVTNMARMFQNCISITSVLDVSGFDTSKVVNMSGMFYNCNASEIDVSGFDTSNVTTMDDMFLGCRGLTVLDVSNFVTDKVTSLRNMFAYCCNVDVLDVSNFNTENVIDMHGMFYYCAKLTSLNLSNFNTEKVTLMGDMFNTCQSLTELDLSSFDTKNLTEMYGMFYNCSYLEVLNLSNFNTEKVEKMKGVFYNIIRLRKLLLGDSFSIMSDTDIPAPSANYVPGADGYWYNSSGDAFAPSEIPSNVADTYYSSILLVP